MMRDQLVGDEIGATFIADKPDFPLVNIVFALDLLQEGAQVLRFCCNVITPSIAAVRRLHTKHRKAELGAALHQIRTHRSFLHGIRFAFAIEVNNQGLQPIVMRHQTVFAGQSVRAEVMIGKSVIRTTATV